MRRLHLIGPTLLLVAASEAALADADDVAFARALAQRGYADIAERVLVRAAQSASGPPERRAESRLALAQFRRLEAMRGARAPSPSAQEIERTRKLLAEAQTAFRGLLTDASSSRAARFELVRLLLATAQFERRVAPKDSPLPLLDEALRLASEGRAAAASEDETASMRLLELEALHARGAATPRNDRSRLTTLARALEEIDGFTWDYAGTLRCAFAFRWRGLVLVEMDKLSEGLESLRDAATSVSEKDRVPGAAEMCFSSYEDIARIAATARGADDATRTLALQCADHLAHDWPRHLENAGGRRARLAVARLAVAAGDAARATKDARSVLVAAGEADPEAADAACAVLADASALPGAAATLDPATLSTLVAAAARSGDADRTANACRALAAVCVSADLRDQYAWDAWEKAGRAYGAAGRWAEAYQCFDEIERAWRNDPSNPKLSELTDTTAYLRADALSRRAAETKDAADSAAAERAMSEFARDHPGSSFASGAREQRAFRALAEAAALRRSGDAEGASVRAKEALAALDAIGEESAMFDRAQALAAEAHRLLGETGEAVRLAQAWLDTKRPEPQSPGARRSRDQGRAQALVTLLTATADKAARTEAGPPRAAAFAAFLDLLKRLEPDLLAVAPRSADQISSWRAEAFLGTGDVDAAETLVLERINARPSGAGTRWLAAEVARADDARALAARGTGAGKVLSLRAARLWEHVLETSETPDPEVARAAAAAYLAGGDLGHAADLYSLAAGLWRGVADRSRSVAERNQALDSARAQSSELMRVLLALSRYSDAASEASILLTKDDDEGAAVLVRLSSGAELLETDVQWIVARAAQDRAALDALAAAYAGLASRESLAAAARAVAALRYTLPRGAAPTAESVELVVRHAEALIRCTAAGGPADGLTSASALLVEHFGTEDAIAAAEKLAPGTRERVEALKKLAADESKRR